MIPKAHAGGCHLEAVPSTGSSFSFSPPLLHLTKGPAISLFGCFNIHDMLKKSPPPTAKRLRRL